MDTTQAVLIALGLAMAVAIVVPYVVRAPGRALHRRFRALGSLKGRSRREIVEAAGEPAIETPLPDGRTLLQWRATGYHIALIFEPDGRCVGVTHENGRRVVGSPSRR